MKKIATLELALPEREVGQPLAIWLYQSIRGAIVDGSLRRGVRLPSTRDFAAQYAVSRGTAVQVFEQLQTEGYVTTRVGAGTFVNAHLPEDGLAPGPQPSSGQLPHLPAAPMLQRPAQPFRANEPGLADFPVETWARTASRRIRKLSTSMLAGGPVLGYEPLRREITEYLGAARGVRCDPAQVVITSGIQQGLDLVARLLLQRGDSAWMEDPAYPGATMAFRQTGARLIAVPVDEEGLAVETGRQLAPDARLVYVTPAHQFGLGVTMSAGRRLALLAWARESGATIFEDDYDSEFRFSRKPVPALAGLDSWGGVVLGGSFNKVLFPSLRLGYLVVPPRLLEGIYRLRHASDLYPPALSQAILCDFMAEGHFARHLRRMRDLYAERLAALEESVDRHLAGIVRMPKIQAGLNTAAFLSGGWTGPEVERRAAAKNLEVTPLDRFLLDRRDIEGILLGFAAFRPAEIRRAVAELGRLLAEAPLTKGSR